MTDIEMKDGNATIRPQPMTAEQTTSEVVHNIGVMAVENIVRLWCPCGWMRVFTPRNEPGTVSVVQLGALNFYAQYHLAHPEEQ